MAKKVIPAPSKPSAVVNIDLEFDPGVHGKKWVACFDWLGFKNYVRQAGVTNVFCDMRWCINELAYHGQLLNVEFAWFSDTFLYHTHDGSRESFCAISQASEWFFDEVVDSGIPLRGALAFGDIYVDKSNHVFLGEAFVDAYEYGERFDWVGFALHHSALDRMAELGQPVSELYYERQCAPFRDRNAARLKLESVVAYGIGQSSALPVVGGNPYLHSVKAMHDAITNRRHRKKYQHTIQFNEHFDNPKHPVHIISRAASKGKGERPA
ncbi:MAG TPA: hypothetical protein VL171_18990 [Verrucomicrobiae bacterium]|nr:hypothetical protein [Verrucomicrobiae bacterium]